jgi:glycosyltransferase involved in cell wall biosynthesis
MKKADLFFFTSVSEDTSTVVMEAISNCLPVLCHDACGFGYVVNCNVGLKIPLSSPQQSVKDFASQIEKVYHHRQLLRELAENCVSRQKELSWDKKSEQVYNMYKQLLQ